MLKNLSNNLRDDLAKVMSLQIKRKLGEGLCDHLSKELDILERKELNTLEDTGFFESNFTAISKWIPKSMICHSKEEAEAMSLQIKEKLGIDNDGVVGVTETSSQTYSNEITNTNHTVFLPVEEEKSKIEKNIEFIKSSIQNKIEEIDSLNNSLEKLTNKIKQNERK